MNIVKKFVNKLLDLRKTFWANAFVIISILTYLLLISYVYVRNFINSNFTEFLGPDIVSFMYCAWYGPINIISITMITLTFIKIKEIVLKKKLKIKNQYILNSKSYCIIFLIGISLIIPTLFFTILCLYCVIKAAF